MKRPTARGTVSRDLTAAVLSVHGVDSVYSSSSAAVVTASDAVGVAGRSDPRGGAGRSDPRGGSGRADALSGSGRSDDLSGSGRSDALGGASADEAVPRVPAVTAAENVFQISDVEVVDSTGVVPGEVHPVVCEARSAVEAVEAVDAVDTSALPPAVSVRGGRDGVEVTVTIGVAAGSPAAGVCRDVYDVISDYFLASGESEPASIAVIVGRIG